MHQTGHNSGVIHSGIYYKPGSLKAVTCRQGIEMLLKFCQKNKIKYEMCGKVIVATKKNEFQVLQSLYNQGCKNGIKGLKFLNSDEIKDYEPNVVGKKGIFCPETGIVDYKKVSLKLHDIVSNKFDVKFDEQVLDIKQINSEICVTTKLNEYRTKFLINCGGLFSDKIAELSGISRQARIVPFRGEYYLLKKHARKLVKNLIYPVPDPRYPYLGVHFTRRINNEIEAGPNAVLAWAREGYNKMDFNLNDIGDYLFYKGFWRMGMKYWDTGLKEYYRSFLKGGF